MIPTCVTRKQFEFNPIAKIACGRWRRRFCLNLWLSGRWLLLKKCAVTDVLMCRKLKAGPQPQKSWPSDIRMHDGRLEKLLIWLGLKILNESFACPVVFELVGLFLGVVECEFRRFVPFPVQDDLCIVTLNDVCDREAYVSSSGEGHL